MGRVYVADASVQQCIDGIIAQNESVIGLVIGQMQMSSSKDLIVHLVRTPSPVPSEGAQPESVTKQWTSLDSVDEHYVANHARQVMRMLLGGLDVIGVFACAKPDELKNAHSRLRQVVFAAHKVLSKMGGPVVDRSHGDRVLIQICSLTKKLTCRTYDVTDHKSAICPAELKFQKFADNFQCLQTTFSLDVVVPVPNDSMSQSLNKQILVGLRPTFVGVWNSMATVNGKLLPDDEPLIGKTTEKSRGRAARTRDDTADAAVFEVSLIQQLAESSETQPSVLVLNCGAKMLIRGTVAAKAFVHAKATVTDAIQALKKDIIHSIIARCELLCEDLLQAEEDQDVKILYETPVRVFASLRHGSSVQFCDYLFPDETASDCASRFCELLGVEVHEDDLITDVEHVPSEADLEKPVKPVRKLHHSRHSELELAHGTQSVCRSYQLVALASSVAVASFAAVISYWFST